MKTHLLFSLTVALTGATVALTPLGAEVAYAQANDANDATGVVNPNGIPQKLELTPMQRRAIYDAVRKDKSKVSPSRFPTAVRRRGSADDRASTCCRTISLPRIRRQNSTNTR